MTKKHSKKETKDPYKGKHKIHKKLSEKDIIKKISKKSEDLITKTSSEKIEKASKKNKTENIGFFKSFSKVIGETFKDFKKVWWRILIVNILTLLTFAVGASLTILLFISLLGLEQTTAESVSSSITGISLQTLTLGFIAFLIGIGALLTWGTNLVKKISVVILGLITIVFVGYLVMFSSLEGGARVLESFIANIQFGGAVSIWQFVSMFLSLFFLIMWLFSWIMTSIITLWGIQKNILANKKANPLNMFFLNSWNYWERFLGLSARMAVYIFWPLLVLYIVMIPISIAINIFVVDPISDITRFGLGTFAGLYMFLILVFLIKRSIDMTFAQTVLIAEDTTSKKAMTKSIELSKNNFWKIFFNLFIVIGTYMLLVSVLESFGPDKIENFKASAEELLKIESLLDFILSFVIFPPIMISFVYRLMNSLSAKK